MPETEPHREPIAKKELLHATTPVRNIVLDEWMAYLTPAELKVVLYVERRTRGWSREWDQIDVGQMMRGIRRKDGTRLDHGTGLGRTACRGAIRSLVFRGALRRIEAVAENGASEPPWYAVNASWSPSRVPEDGTARHAGVSENRRGRVSESDRGTGSQSDRGEGVTNEPPGGGSQSDPHKTYSPVSPLCGEGRLFEVSPPDASLQKGRGLQKPPQTSSSSSGKETTIDDDDYAEQAKREAEPDAAGEDTPQREGSEEELGGWRELETRASVYSVQAKDVSAGDLVEEFAEGLGLQDRREDLTRVLAWMIDRYPLGAYDCAFYVVERCASECEAGNVRHPWSYLLTSLVAEANETLRYLESPEPVGVVRGIRDEDVLGALEGLRGIPGFPADEEGVERVLRAHQDDVMRCNSLEVAVCDYADYVAWFGGLDSAIKGVVAPDAARHLDGFLEDYADKEVRASASAR